MLTTRFALAAFVLLLTPVILSAQSATIDPAAKRDIAAGNQAWIDGMKTGNARQIAATYAEDAVDCGPTGECIQGRAAIERQLASRSQKLGRAVSASVTSKGSVQQGDFVYEWGQAEASFAHAAPVSGRYLTVWRKQADGHWQIFRNMPIPPDQTR